VRVLEFSERVMRNHIIKYIKILWSNQMEREATWELESIMRNKYPDLFRLVSSLRYMFHISFFGSVVEAAEFEGEFFLRGRM
jgi:hypothetical protein